MDLNALRGMLPDVSRSPIARSTGLLLHNISAAAVKMNTYEFVNHISSDGLLYDDPEEGADIRALLNSKFDAEKAEGLKRLLALISSGTDVCSFFPDVIKVVVSQSMPVKRMAYTFLAHFSSRRPDEALMVINTLQKELGSPNALTRAHGIRAMAAMRLRSATPVVLLSVRRASRDPSPLVRRCAALALASVHALECPPSAWTSQDVDADTDTDNPEAAERGLSSTGTDPSTEGVRTSTGGTEDEILELLDVLLADGDPGVVGAACCSYACICPWRLEPLGAHFRSLCNMLGLIDEWGQAAVLELLLRYGVAKFGHADKATWPAQAQQLVEADPVCAQRSRGASWGVPSPSGAHSHSLQRPEDLQLLLRTTRMLVQAQSGAVVLGACALHWELNSDVSEIRSSIVPALLFLLRRVPQCQNVVLTCISTMAAVAPALFLDRVDDLFVLPSDSRSVRQQKLDLLVRLACESNADVMLKELEDYVQDLDPWFSVLAIRAVGECAVKLPGIRTPAVRGLLQLLSMHTTAHGREGEGQSTENGEGGEGGKGRSGEVGESAAGTSSQESGGRSSAESGGGEGCGSGPREMWGEAREEEKGHGGDTLVLEVLVALTGVIEICPEYHLEVMLMLLPRLQSIEPPQAQAVIVWMLGFAAPSSWTVLQAAPFALHPLVAHFGALSSAFLKLQLLNTATRVLLLLLQAAAKAGAGPTEQAGKAQLSVATTSALARSVVTSLLDSASTDSCIDVRDRARFIRGLVDIDRLMEQGLSRTCEETLAWKAFCGPRVTSGSRGEGEAETEASRAESVIGASASRGRFPLSSLSHYVNHMTPSYTPLPKGRSLAPPEVALVGQTGGSEAPSGNGVIEQHAQQQGEEDRGQATRRQESAVKSQSSENTETVGKRESDGEVGALGSKSELENWLGSG